MKKALTIRLGAAQRKALRSCATATGKTESNVVRELFAIQLRAKVILGERAGHYLGQLDFEPASLDRDPWRAHLRRMTCRLEFLKRPALPCWTEVLPREKTLAEDSR
jgi:hypothetical protein